MFDILGFKQMVARYNIDYLRRRLGADLDAQLNAMTRHFDNRSIARISDKRFSSYRALWKTLAAGQPAYCEHVRFSDTILLYTKQTNAGAFRRLLVASQRLLATSIFTGIPMRGAITAGELYVSPDKRLYLGDALVRAHELERQQDWAGAILDEERLAPRPLSQSLKKELTRLGLLADYPAPAKKGPVGQKLCIGWPLGIGVEPSYLRRALEVNTPLDWGARRKVRETIDFYIAYHEANASNEAHIAGMKNDLRIKIRQPNR